MSHQAFTLGSTRMQYVSLAVSQALEVWIFTGCMIPSDGNPPRRWVMTLLNVWNPQFSILLHTAFSSSHKPWGESKLPFLFRKRPSNAASFQYRYPCDSSQHKTRSISPSTAHYTCAFITQKSFSHSSSNTALSPNVADITKLTALHQFMPLASCENGRLYPVIVLVSDSLSLCFIKVEMRPDVHFQNTGCIFYLPRCDIS